MTAYVITALLHLFFISPEMKDPIGLPPPGSRPAPALPAPVEESTKIDELKRGEITEEKEVSVTGQFRGWSSCKDSWSLTRSDWVIEDESGCLFISGKLPAGLNASRAGGENVLIVGKVKRNQTGKILIQASEVRVLPGKKS